jgi:hypothetical protein
MVSAVTFFFAIRIVLAFRGRFSYWRPQLQRKTSLLTALFLFYTSLTLIIVYMRISSAVTYDDEDGIGTEVRVFGLLCCSIFCPL